MTNLNRVLTAATVAGLAFATASFSVAAADEAKDYYSPPPFGVFVDRHGGYNDKCFFSQQAPRI